jgi:hypothetical protein
MLDLRPKLANLTVHTEEGLGGEMVLSNGDVEVDRVPLDKAIEQVDDLAAYLHEATRQYRALD